MPLPLSARKKIRDSEPKLKEALERIQKATDKEWTFEVDWEANINQLADQSCKDNIGSLYQEDVMGGVAQCIEKACQDNLTKESLNECTPNSKITIRVNDKIPSGYWHYKFENGDIVVEHKKSIANISDVTYFDLARAIPSQSGALSLVIRKDIESTREKQQELLDSIAQITGSGEWVLEVDWNANVAKLENQSCKDSIGSIYIDDVLKNVEYLLKNKLSENPTLKEAFVEATSSRTITIQVNPKIESYWNLSIKDGQLIIQHKPTIANISDVSYYNLAKIIPVPGGMSLVAKLNLEQNKEKYDEAMEKIKTATGEEFTFDESCLLPMYEKLDKSQAENIGDIVYAEVIPNIASNIEKRMGDEMVKEAFMEACSARQIILKPGGPKQDKYWDMKFENGALVIYARMPSVCNLSDISYFDFEKLL